jgi:hypothetical protein
MKLRRAGKTMITAGVLLILLFFSPFVSCGARTYSGAEAFQASIPLNAYDEPKDGLLIVIFPFVGLVGTLIGYQVKRRAGCVLPRAITSSCSNTCGCIKRRPLIYVPLALPASARI